MKWFAMSILPKIMLVIFQSGAGGRKFPLFLAMPTAAKLRDHLSVFIDYCDNIGEYHPFSNVNSKSIILLVRRRYVFQ